jgi:hypothetical protein
MIQKHKLYDVFIEWHDTKEREESCVSVGDGIDTSIDDECVFSFTESEWSDVKAKVKKAGRSNCGDFSITKIRI